ncbi:MAG: type I glyceraldehyde-3-phosphate dehydrogenase [Gemmataceae bacterium]
MPVRVGINGFGRIGRMVFRAMWQRPEVFDVVAVNDLTEPKQLAYLLQYDSAHGRFAARVEASEGQLRVQGKPLKVLSIREPGKIPWADLGVTVVVESTGFFTEREGPKGGFADHLKGGAKKVVISAPAKGEDIMIVLGVNDDKLQLDHTFVSNASCTTNCLAPMVKVLHEAFGIVRGFMTTVHAYTNDQRVADLIHPEEIRRARAAAVNIIPTKTGAAASIHKVMPALKGRLHGMALRVPILDGSVTDLTVELEKPVTASQVNEAFKAAAEGRLQGIIEYTADPIVSSDIINNPHSCIFDSLATLTVPPEGPGHMVKVLGWYDNEWGYSCRTADLVARLGKFC